MPAVNRDSKRLKRETQIGQLMVMTSADIAIVVFEAQPYWGPELLRQFQHTEIAIRECRKVDDLLPAANQLALGLLVVDLSSGLKDCLHWFNDVSCNRQRWPIIACGSNHTADLEWALRDAGVSAYLPDIVTGTEMAHLCRKLLGLIPARTAR